MEKTLQLNYLELSSQLVKFEPVSKITNVFFDEANKEVMSVRGGGSLGVVVKGYEKTLTFCMDHKESISSIKFSSDHSLLAVQRNSTAVEILTCKEGKLTPLHTQECKAKGADVLGFFWSDLINLVLVNDHAVELYQVIKEKSSVRFLKNYNQNTKWFVWNSQCQMLILCTALATTTASFQPYFFSQGQIVKTPKFEVDLSCNVSAQSVSNGGVNLTERDVCIAALYELDCVLVLQHSGSPTVPAKLSVYSKGKDMLFRKSHVCLLELTGKFAVNIIDSIIVVHHQSSQTSLLFDIKSGIKNNSAFESVYPLTLPQSIRPFELEDGNPVPAGPAPRTIPCQLYAPTWVFFQPNIIIDARMGLMWDLNLSLDALTDLVDDKIKLVVCLLRRKEGKALVLSVVKDEIKKLKVNSLGVIFDRINACYLLHLNSVLQSQVGDCMTGLGSLEKCEGVSGSVVIDPAELYSSVFAPLMESIINEEEGSSLTYKAMIGIVLDYIRSLNEFDISVPSYINELVINGLVTTRQFYQLHQLLQYHVLPDSKKLALILLSLVGVYEGAQQLCLDMFSRLNSAHDEIIEILLERKMVVQALRYSKSVGYDQSIPARKFLEVAMTTEDPLVFYSTFKFFTKRNLSLRGKIAFSKGEHCDEYVKHFLKLFHESGETSSINSFIE